MAFSCAEFACVYSVGSKVIAQSAYGVVQSGSGCTTWLDLFCRVYWTKSTAGYTSIWGERRFNDNVSPLVARSIKIAAGKEDQDFCGRDWQVRSGSYQLSKWKASIAKVALTLVDIREGATEGFRV